MNHCFITHKYYESLAIKNDSNHILWTIIAGVSVFLLGQLLLEFIIKPLRGYRNVKNEVFNKLKLYSAIITNPLAVEDLIIDNSFRVDVMPNKNKEEFDKKHNWVVYERYISIAREIRKLSCDLEVKYLDNYSLIRNSFLIREDGKNITDAVYCLMQISNSLFDKSKAISNSKDIEKIKKYLNF